MPQSAVTLTGLAGIVMIGTACTFMWFGIYTPTRAFFYIIAVALAFLGSGFKPHLTLPGSLFLLAGGLYIVKALLCPPVPRLVLSDIANILLGFAVLWTFALPDFTRETWECFQLKAHRTVLATSTVGAGLGLAKLAYYNQGGIVPVLMDPERGYPLGTSLRIDYNFYSLPLLLGILSAFWLMKKDNSSRWCTASLLCLPVLVSAVLLSGSRRGLITVLCVVPILSAWFAFSPRHTRPVPRGARISWKVVLTCGCLAVGFCILKLDPLTQFIKDLTSADSFSDIMGRWRTFEDGTYSDSRMHYWSIAMQRLSRFEPLDYVFGEGFAYVTDLGADPEIAEDYPHNFLLSSLLYGGLVQTACLVVMVSLALVRLSRRAQGSGMVAGWFVLVLFFLLTSCNSFFSSEIAVFLSIIGLGIKRFEPGRVSAMAQQAMTLGSSPA
jgi:hypothetical protein